MLSFRVPPLSSARILGDLKSQAPAVEIHLEPANPEAEIPTGERLRYQRIGGW